MKIVAKRALKRRQLIITLIIATGLVILLFGFALRLATRQNNKKPIPEQTPQTIELQKNNPSEPAAEPGLAPQQSPSQQEDTTPAKPSTDCAALNNSQRSLYAQAADALYSAYQSQKSINQVAYDDYIDEQNKQQAIDAANNLAYSNYQTKMDINNNKYFNGLAINNCSGYYQKITYASR